MPKYQTTAQRQHRYQMIARAEGERCIICFIEKRKIKKPPNVKLEIDHADSNPTNWSWRNLHLVCHRCNCKMRQLPAKKHIKFMRDYSDQLERERERENLPTWKTVLKEELPYETGSPEMQANKNFEPQWLRYVHNEVRSRGTVPRKEIISGGAAYSHCSIQTSTNYLTKYTSPISPFMEALDEDGNKVIRYR